MHYGQIRKYDVANGLGIRVTFFVTGCTHNCFNCFNKDYQNFDSGKLWLEENTQEVIEYLKDPNVAGLSILGGEPFQNTLGILDVVKKVKAEIDKPIWIWTGYLYEGLINNEDNRELLNYCDVLIDGPFKEELKDLTLKYKGSKNQRVIDVKQTIKENKVILLEDL